MLTLTYYSALAFGKHDMMAAVDHNVSYWLIYKADLAIAEKIHASIPVVPEII